MAEKHPCKGDFLDKLVQPAVLAMLCEGPAYGLMLLDRLEKHSLACGADTTGFYRSLKKLEADGKLISYWDTEGNSRPRRVYSITPAGMRCLANWNETLKAYVEDVRRVSQAVTAACAGAAPVEEEP